MCKSFKQIISLIVIISSREEFLDVCTEIDISFENGKISWKDHELLYELISKIKY